jgi:hypothetical protein
VRTHPNEARHERPLEATGPLECALRTSARLGDERSLVDLVLLACEFSDDPLEIEGLVDGLVAESSSRLVPASDDPMLCCRPRSESAEGPPQTWADAKAMP